MVIEPGAFSAAINYVAELGGPQTPVVFTPQGRSVRVSVAHHERYAEYWLDTVEPLAERFAVHLFALPAMAAELGDDRILYRVGSAAVFEAGNRVWRLNYCAKVDDGRPDVKIQETFGWDNSLSPLLSLARQATGAKRSKLTWDCVCAEWRSDRRSLIGTTESMMTACVQAAETPIEGVASLLIDRANVPLILATCASGGAVRFNLGLRHYSVNCGKRIAVFTMVEGRFPAVGELVRWGRSVSRDRKRSEGVATVPAARLLQSVRQSLVLGDAISLWSENERLLMSSRDAAARSEVELSDRSTGSFGSLTVRASFLKGIANGWPTESIQIQKTRGEEPLVFSTPGRDKAVVSIVMPVGGEDS